MKTKDKPLIYGALGSIALFLFYFFIMTVTSSYNNAVDQFLDLWYLFTLLIFGFGLQIGLYTYIRNWHLIDKDAKKSVIASTGVSTGSMIACCAHHLTDILPIIGFSAAALFLSKYQIVFIFIGIISNLIGVILMLRIIKRKNLFDRTSKIMKILIRYNLDLLLKVTIIASALVLPILIIKYSEVLK